MFSESPRVPCRCRESAGGSVAVPVLWEPQWPESCLRGKHEAPVREAAPRGPKPELILDRRRRPEVAAVAVGAS